MSEMVHGYYLSRKTPFFRHRYEEFIATGLGFRMAAFGRRKTVGGQGTLELR
jgi:hypothetical protein